MPLSCVKAEAQTAWQASSRWAFAHASWRVPGGRLCERELPCSLGNTCSDQRLWEFGRFWSWSYLLEAYRGLAQTKLVVSQERNKKFKDCLCVSVCVWSDRCRVHADPLCETISVLPEAAVQLSWADRCPYHTEPVTWCVCVCVSVRARQGILCCLSAVIRRQDLMVHIMLFASSDHNFLLKESSFFSPHFRVFSFSGKLPIAVECWNYGCLK